MGVPVVIGGDNQPSPVGIGLTDLPNIGVIIGDKNIITADLIRSHP